MNQVVVKNVNNGNVTKWIQQKGVTNNLEIQKFKSNVLAIASQYGLDNANPETLINSCYQAVLINLPLEKNFGYCYVVPFNRNYKDKDGNWQKECNAQFQMGYKGYIQLSLRTQQYKNISVSDVRNGEIKKNDPLKGITFNWIMDPVKRLRTNIIGYTAYFKLKNGFEKYLYMSKEQIEQHFLKYSKTYAKNKKFELASFDDMALKTVLTQLLRKWGIMSTEMQQAYESDQAVITDNEKIYIDNPNNDIQTKFYNSLTNPDNPFENAQEIIDEYNQQENKKITKEHINNIKVKKAAMKSVNNVNPTFTVPSNFEEMQNDIDELELDENE